MVKDRKSSQEDICQGRASSNESVLPAHRVQMSKHVQENWSCLASEIASPCCQSITVGLIALGRGPALKTTMAGRNILRLMVRKTSFVQFRWAGIDGMKFHVANITKSGKEAATFVPWRLPPTGTSSKTTRERDCLAESLFFFLCIVG